MIPMPLPRLSFTPPRNVGCSMAGGLTHPRPSFAMRETDFNHRQSRGGMEHGVYLDRALELAMRHPLRRSSHNAELDSARNRVLSHSLESLVDDPRFDNSAGRLRREGL